jgi:hypothetical protein
MKNIMNLYEAMNTYNIALFTIKNKGYKICPVIENDETIFFEATKDNKNISGFNPVSLLGLINIAEEYGENWRQVNTGNLYDEIMELVE